MVSLGPRQRAFLLSSPDQIFARFDGFTGPDAVVNQGIGSRHPLSSFLVPSLMPAKLCLSPLRFRFARRGIQPGGKSLGEGSGYSKRRRREIVGWKFGRGEGRGRRVAIVGSVGERERERGGGKDLARHLLSRVSRRFLSQVGVRVVFEGRSFPSESPCGVPLARR